MEMQWIRSLFCGDVVEPVVEPGDVVDIPSNIWRCGESTIWHVEMWLGLEMWLIHTSAYGDVDPQSGMWRCGRAWRSTIQHTEMWWIHNSAYGDMVDPQSGMWRCGGTCRCG